jgi:hypothetical protein
MAYNSGTDPTLAELITRKFIPEQFVKEALMHTMSELVTANAFTHKYQPNLRKGYKVSIPVMTEIGATEVTPGTRPTAQDASTTAVSITVDQWYQTAVDASPLIEIEDAADYLNTAARSAAYSIDKKIDTSVGALIPSLSSSSVYGADGQTFTDEIFRALVETLDEDDVPNSGRFIIGDPSMKSDMMDIDKFIRMDYINGSPTTNGKFGELYGAKIYITNNLTAATTGNYGVYAHTDAIGVVIQKGPNVKYWDLGFEFQQMIIVDAAWGAAEIRDNFGKAFYTRSK